MLKTFFLFICLTITLTLYISLTHSHFYNIFLKWFLCHSVYVSLPSAVEDMTMGTKYWLWLFKKVVHQLGLRTDINYLLYLAILMIFNFSMVYYLYCTSGKYGYIVPVRNTSTLYRCEIQVHCTGAKYRYIVPVRNRCKIRVHCTGAKYGYIVPVRNTGTLYQWGNTGTLYYCEIRVHCTGAKYWYIVPVRNTGTLYRWGNMGTLSLGDSVNSLWSLLGARKHH